jgi:hypothetical protein
LFDVSPSAFGLVDNLVTQASRYGKQTQVFNGVDMTVSARFAGSGQLSGGLSVGRTVTDNCYQNDDPSLLGQNAVATYPRTDAFCHLAPPWSAGTQVKLMAVYPLPWNIQTSAVYQNSPGIPTTAQYVVTNAAIVPSLGRNLASCRGAATCNANVTVDLIPPTVLFEPRLQQLDLRFSRIIPLGGTRRLRADIDVYNVFNVSNVLSMNTTYGSVWQDVRQILGGRLVRLGGQINF